MLEAESEGEGKNTAPAVPSSALAVSCKPARLAHGAARPAGVAKEVEQIERP